MEQSSSSTLSKPNDGMVPLSSVESQDYFINLGHSKSCHTNLMSDYEYGLAKEVIVEGSSSNHHIEIDLKYPTFYSSLN